jgi:two-component system chemotaxis response regulator CheY
MRSIVENALRQSEGESTEILHASNGLDALGVIQSDSVKAHPLDLILCDVHMPKMNGLEFLLEKRRNNLAPDVPTVMITADASDPQVLRALAEGAQGYISKPFTLEQIKSRLASLLLTKVSPLGLGDALT